MKKGYVKKIRKDEPKPDEIMCKKCNRSLPFIGEFFPKDKSRKYGLRRICRECIGRNKTKNYQKTTILCLDGDPEAIEKIKTSNKRKREWAHKNPDKERNARLKSVFGITLDDYNSILKEQNYVCAICNNKCSTGKNLSVDHDHITNKIRGLLCDRCNFGIGCFNDNVELLLKATEYLKRTNGE